MTKELMVLSVRSASASFNRVTPVLDSFCYCSFAAFFEVIRCVLCSTITNNNIKEMAVMVDCCQVVFISENRSVPTFPNGRLGTGDMCRVSGVAFHSKRHNHQIYNPEQ